MCLQVEIPFLAAESFEHEYHNILSDHPVTIATTAGVAELE